MYMYEVDNHYLVHNISFVYIFKNVAFLYHIMKICVCGEMQFMELIHYLWLNGINLLIGVVKCVLYNNDKLYKISSMFSKVVVYCCLQSSKNNAKQTRKGYRCLCWVLTTKLWSWSKIWKFFSIVPGIVNQSNKTKTVSFKYNQTRSVDWVNSCVELDSVQ